MHADEMRDQRHDPHDHQNHRDHGKVALEIVVRPPNQEIDDPAAKGEARDQEHGGPQDGLGNAHDVDRARLSEAEGDCDDHPADGIFADRRGDDDLSEIAPGEAHFAHDRRHDLDRGNRQSGAEEERREQALIRMRQQRLRHELAKREAANERYSYACNRDAQRRFADRSHELKVGLHPGQQQQQKNAELRDAVEHGFLLRRARKDGVLQGGPNHSQHGGAKDNAAEQHSHDRRLADAVHDLTQEAAYQHQCDELCEEDDVRGAGLGAFGCESCARAQHQRADSAPPGAQARARRGEENGRPGHGLGARGRSIRRDGESFHSPSLSARRDFSQQPAGARHGPPCNCKLFATRLCRCRRIVSMAVSSVPEGRSSSSPGHAETGWRHSRSTPSLSEVFGSIATRPKGPLWKKLMAFLGPGYLVAVGYMDPGNWATSLAGGSKFGYALLTIALLSNLMAIVLQSLCTRLGVGAGRDLAQACRDSFPRYVALPLWLSAEVAITATDLAEVIGTAIGLYLLFHIPLEIGVIITAADVFLILALQAFGFRWIEAFVVTMLGVIAACFAVQIALADPNWGAVLRGFAPSAEILRNPQMLYLALGILGATVMPHNLYLHSGLVQTRGYGDTPAEKREAITLATIDSTIALCLAFVINASILILAAATFNRTGKTEIAELDQAHSFLAPLLGSTLAPTLFAVALLCCGLNSTITATLSGQIVMEGILN